jgi:chlorite dismutase
MKNLNYSLKKHKVKKFKHTKKKSKGGQLALPGSGTFNFAGSNVGNWINGLGVPVVLVGVRELMKGSKKNKQKGGRNLKKGSKKNKQKKGGKPFQHTESYYDRNLEGQEHPKSVNEEIEDVRKWARGYTGAAEAEEELGRIKNVTFADGAEKKHEADTAVANAEKAAGEISLALKEIEHTKTPGRFSINSSSKTLEKLEKKKKYIEEQLSLININSYIIKNLKLKQDLIDATKSGDTDKITEKLNEIEDKEDAKLLDSEEVQQASELVRKLVREKHLQNITASLKEHRMKAKEKTRELKSALEGWEAQKESDQNLKRKIENARQLANNMYTVIREALQLSRELQEGLERELQEGLERDLQGEIENSNNLLRNLQKAYGEAGDKLKEKERERERERARNNAIENLERAMNQQNIPTNDQYIMLSEAIVEANKQNLRQTDIVNNANNKLRELENKRAEEKERQGRQEEEPLRGQEEEPRQLFSKD